MIESGGNLRASLRFAAFSLLIALVVIAITAVPIALPYRVVGLVLLFVFVMAFFWHQQRATWEARARKRTITTIRAMGTLMIVKGVFSQVGQGLGFAGVLSDSANEPFALLVLSAFAVTPWQIDALFIVMGSCALVSLLWFFKPAETASYRIPVSTASEMSSDVAVSRYSVFETYDSDLPPMVDVWVGRAAELSVLNEFTGGVVAITGIGGQGKSALTATFLGDLRLKDQRLFWDWRDCKEQADRFRTQLASVIQHLTQGDVTARDIADADIVWLSRFFFQKAGSTRGVIVFDNVDHYVDVNKSLFTSSVSTFVTEALRVDHKLTILFTCRPRISYPSVRFREVYLRGFDLSDTLALFGKRLGNRGVAGHEEHVRALHELTDGHPLWLNIIAAQLGRKPETGPEIVRQLQLGTMDDRSRSILRGIWSTLHERQRRILICMSELPRSMEAEMIFEYLGGAVGAHNRFDRAFQGLRAISLITEKRSGGADPSRFELHPMVRAFVRTEYRDRTERNDHLDRLLASCHVIVARLVGDGAKPLTIVALEQLTTRAELELARGRIDACISSLLDSLDHMVVKGVAYEYVRLGKGVLDAIDWNDKANADNANLDRLVYTTAKLMAEVGNDNFASYLEKYAKTVTPGTARHIGLCDIRTYTSWLHGDYEEAIKWGELGVKTKRDSDIDTTNDASHNLALARRDSGDVARALQHFCHGETLENVLASDHLGSNRDASFYGNIGRCLALQGDADNALVLYAKSYELLTREKPSQQQQLNLGYAAHWISQALIAIGRPSEATRFCLQAFEIWRKRAPKLSEGPHAMLGTLGFTDRESNLPQEGREWYSGWIATHASKAPS